MREPPAGLNPLFTLTSYQEAVMSTHNDPPKIVLHIGGLSLELRHVSGPNIFGSHHPRQEPPKRVVTMRELAEKALDPKHANNPLFLGNRLS